MFTRLFASLFLLLALATPASAIPVTMQFSVSGFAPSNGNAAPTDPVSGTVVWEAASATADIQALISISLTLDGHVYTLAETTFMSPYTGPGNSIVGGVTSGVNSINDFTDDFWMYFSQSGAYPISSFGYASSQRSGIWESANYTQFSITAGNAVPEPASIAMLGLGLAALGLTRRRKVAQQ